MPPIRLAFIGAGIFARDAHLPSLQALGDTFELAAIYSHRLETAALLRDHLPHPVDVTGDLDALLARDDIDAVDVLLPIHIIPDAVMRALRAGKHVISEKPAAPDLATGRQLLAHYARHPGPVWMVAENWRYEPAFVQAAALVREGAIGRPLLCHWAIHTNMTPHNKYYATAWRRSGAFPGGFLLDGGVHHVAGLRLVLGEIASVSAALTQHRPDLPPADTLSATLTFDSGVVGSYAVTYASDAPWPPALRIVGERGALAMPRDHLELTQDEHTRRIPLPPHQSVQDELAAFAAAIRDGTPHRNPPEQGVQDVAVVEAMLKAAESGRRVTVARVVD
jgi:predicted dehydrogenase